MEEVITFENQTDFIREQINKRKKKWFLSTLDWEDVEQLFMIHIWEKFHLYTPAKGKFENWVNTVISNYTINLLRDNLTKFTRPCLKCTKNLGGNFCEYTKSHTQCSECPLYAKWQRKKEAEYNIKASLPLENHSQEVNNKQSDFLDIEVSKKIIDEKINQKLNRREKKIYRMLYVDHLTPMEVSEELKKEKSKLYDPESYAKILQFQKKIIEMAKKVIKDEAIC